MRLNNYFLPSLKETPAEAELTSHRYMLRSGMIRKLASGLYTWLPLGLRVLHKVEQIIRAEMNAVGAQEILMPAVQPAELWQESGRWDKYGKELLRFHDRHDREFCFGPTHEEVITKLVAADVRSYKQLPLTLYQIQMKFRDEIRPRFGLMRAREFLMKDAYSFHTSQESLQETYDAMFAAYKRIFTRLGLDFRAVIADSGSIGGTGSHEFHVLSESGEDVIAYSDGSDYAANLEKAAALPSVSGSTVAVDYMVVLSQGEYKFLLYAAGDTLNDVKIANFFHGNDFVVLDAAAKKHYVANIAAPEYFPLIIADHSLRQALTMQLQLDERLEKTFEFCFSESSDNNICHIPKDRTMFADLRNVRAGDNSPDGKGTLHLVRGIEVGHVFQLGDKYTAAMGANVLGQDGKNSALLSGCYGIGVSRVVAAAIEQKHDERGIIWSDAMAPYQIIILPLLWHKSFRVKELAEKIYADLTAKGYEVMLDDRKERAGVMFSTAELIGIPHTLVISEKGIEAGQIEYNHRATNGKENVAVDRILQFITEKVCVA